MNRNELVNLANSMGFDPTTIANDSKLEAHLKYLMANQSTMAGTLAEGTVTLGGDLTDGDQILIGTSAQGGITYTFKTALTGAKATGVLTLTDQFSEGETVTVEGQTYTFRATPLNPYDVDIGASAAASLDNLKQAINQGDTEGAGEGEGTNYGTGTVFHPLVTATTNTNTEQTVQARDYGTRPNSYMLSETCAAASWGGATMSGGVATVPNEVLLGANAAASLDNLKVAINAGATAGTNYSLGTQAHPLVTATTNTDTTQLVVARDFAVGEDISTTDPVDAGTDISWGATTLASGVSDQNAVNAAAVAGAGKGVNANV
jgi:hypothetical protein